MAKKSQRWETMDKGNTSLEKLTLEYEAFNRTEGKTDKTVKWYNYCLHLLADYLAENNHSGLLRDLDLEVIRGYVLYLQKRPKNHSHPFMPQYKTGLSLVTVENYVRAIRAFFS